MSKAAKLFLGSSVAICGLTIWGVHFLQQRESDTMYQGVLKDEARMKIHPLTLAGLTNSTSEAAPSRPPPVVGALSSSSPMNTPSSPSRAPGIPINQLQQVQQPAAVIDPDCDTCRISPPAALVEKQSAEERRLERAAREEEYRAQRGLEERLRRDQGVGIGERLV